MKDLFLLAVIILLFAFVARDYSYSNSLWTCEGDLTRTGEKSPITIYMRLEQHRWWLSLLRKNDGKLVLEMPRLMAFHFDQVRVGNTQLRIFDRGQFRGAFSTVSHTLSISIAADFFEGSCVRTESENSRPDVWNEFWK